MEKCLFLESFKFCPKCGGEFIDNNEKSKKCIECGFVFYFNPSAAVAAIIKNSAGDILISTRDREPAKGTYDLPGGFVDSYESAEHSVCREVKEECNLEVEEVKYLFSLPNIYNYSNFDVHTLDMFFECSVKDYKPLKADDDVASLEFIAVDDIDISKFGLQSVREGIERYIKNIGKI
ncbi:MAG: NUDIX domain-containing protein [Rikenellaceae bacterium]